MNKFQKISLGFLYCIIATIYGNNLVMSKLPEANNNLVEVRAKLQKAEEAIELEKARTPNNDFTSILILQKNLEVQKEGEKLANLELTLVNVQMFAILISTFGVLGVILFKYGRDE